MKLVFKDKNIFYIFFACILACSFFIVSEFLFTNGKMGVPLDDTWIHFQFADNFSKGFFYQYNPGEPVAGTTSPLYVILLSAFNFIFNNFLFTSVLLSVAFYLLSCILIYKISVLILDKFASSHYTKELSLLVALLTIFNGRFTWAALSGMETTMFTFFCLSGIYFYIKNLQSLHFTILPSLLLSLAAVSRPEGYLLFGLYMFDMVLNFHCKRKLKFRFLMLSFLIFALIAFPYLIFSYNISGHFFPNTFRGQGGSFRFLPDLNYLRIVVIYFFRDNFITGCLYLVSIIFYFAGIKKFFSEFKYLNLIFLWAIFLPVVSAFLIPNWRHHVRYMIPLVPFINLVSIIVLVNLLDKKYFSRFKSILANKKILFSSLISVSLIYFVVYALAIGKNTDNINSQQVKLGHWVKENVKQSDVIAVNDIGAITFISKNKIIDMAGLVTPEILKFRDYSRKENLDSINYLLKENNVSYIIIYDNWFEEYLKEYGSSLKFVTSAYLEDNTICGGNEMKVYKTNF